MPHLRHWRFMLWRISLLLAAIAPSALAQANPLPQRETLSYNVEWRLITAGKLRIAWQQEQTAGQVALHLESVGLVSKFFRVEDDYRSAIGRSLCTESSQLTSHEGNRHRDTRVAYDGETRKASYLERDLARNSVLQQHEIEIPPCVHDVVGGLYYLRTLNLEPGQSVTVPVSDGKKSAMAKVEAQQREDIKTPAGAFHTIRYEAYVFDNVLYKRPAHLNLWLTDDRRKLPVQIRVRMQFTIGTINLQLEKNE
jgi:Protein of unknown function (DUF3108)